MDDKGCRLGRQRRSGVKWPSQPVGEQEIRLQIQAWKWRRMQNVQQETRAEEINRMRHRS